MVADPTTSQIRDYGTLILALTLQAPEWILRRVETLRIVDDITANVRVSTDYDLRLTGAGPVYKSFIDNNDLPQLLLPLGFLAKEPLHDFSLFDQSGNPVSFLTQEETSPISIAAVEYLAAFLLNTQDIPPSISTFIRSVVDLGPEEGEALVLQNKLLGASQDDRRTFSALIANPEFRYVITNLARSFIAIAVLPGDAKHFERRILKYSYVITMPWDWSSVRSGKRGLLGRGLMRLALRPSDVKLEVPLVSTSRSYHADVEAPANLELRQAEIGRKHGTEDAILQQYKGKFTRAHLHLREGTFGVTSAYELRLKVSPQRRGFIRGAAAATVFSTLALLVVLLFIGQIDHTDSASPIPIITIVPGLLAAYLSRPTEHPLASRLYFGLRCVLALSALLAWLAAVATVLNLDGTLLRVVMVCLMGLSLMCSVIAVTAYVRASGKPDSVKAV